MSEMKDIGFDEEMKKKLDSFSAIQVDAEFRYIPKVYREKDASGNYKVPKDLWPVFRLRGITGADLMMIGDELKYTIDTDGKVAIPNQTGRMAALTCKYCILGWSNFRTSDGKEIGQPRKDPTLGCLVSESLGVISAPLMFELSNVIVGEGRMTEEELLGLGY
jgi:hypothetical protein